MPQLFCYTIGYSPPGSSVHGINPSRVTGVGLPTPSPGGLPYPGIEPTFPMSLSLTGGFFIVESPGSPLVELAQVKS